MAELDTAQASAAAKLLELIFIQRISQAIHVAAALQIADLIADEPKSAEQLAKATGVQAASLRRVMRTLAGFGVFAQERAEEGSNRFALTPMGEFLKAVSRVLCVQRRFSLVARTRRRPKACCCIASRPVRPPTRSYMARATHSSIASRKILWRLSCSMPQ